jgi:hypothetical protein
MSYWNGIAWNDGTPVERPAHRAVDRTATAAMLLGAIALLIPMLAASASRGGSAGCEVNPSSADVGEVYVVRAWGLPTGLAINLWTNEDGVTTGSPLGGTPDGTFALDEVSNSPGVTTYSFSGPTKKHTTVYSRCTVSAY